MGQFVDLGVLPVVAHGVDVGLGLFQRRAGFFRIAREVMEPGFIDQGIAEKEPHAGGLGDVAHPGQILPGPFEIAMRPPETGAAEIAERNKFSGGGLTQGGDGGIRALSARFVLIATGSVPREVPMAPTDGDRVVNSDHI